MIWGVNINNRTVTSSTYSVRLPSWLYRSQADRHYFWIQSQFQGGVRNADVLKQKLEAMDISESLRTVERTLRPFRQSWEHAEKATMRFEAEPRRQSS